MSRGLSIQGGSRPSKPFDLKELNNYPGRRAKYINITEEALIRDALKDLFNIPREGTGVPRERLPKVSLEVLTHFGYVKDWPNLPVVIINDKAFQAFKELNGCEKNT